jgi:hypothetical protein
MQVCSLSVTCGWTNRVFYRRFSCALHGVCPGRVTGSHDLEIVVSAGAATAPAEHTEARGGRREERAPNNSEAVGQTFGELRKRLRQERRGEPPA